MRIGIRNAVPADVDWLLGQLQEFSRFFGSRHELFGDETYVRDALSLTMQNHLFLIAERADAGPVGFIAGLVSQHVFNPKIRVLQEILWWVAEPYRGSRAGLLLLKHFIDWGKRNADWIQCTLEDKSPVNDRILLRHGFRPKERAFLLEVT